MKRNAQAKGFYNVVNKSTEDKVGVINIYGNIPDYDWDNWEMINSVNKFVKDFKKLEAENDRIDIHINCLGGSLYHAFPMYNVIASSKKDIHTFNDGIAASAGAFLLCAGKTVHAAKNSITMIHNGLTYAAGNAQDLRDMAETLDTYDQQIAGMFADKTGMSVEEVMNTYMNYKDHYLTATKAHEAKLIDVIEDYSAENIPENITNMADIRNYFNSMEAEEEISPSFLTKIVDKLRPLVSNFLPTNTQIQEEIPMKLENLSAVLNAAGDKGVTLSPEQVNDLKNELEANKNVVTQAELDAAVENAKKEKDAEILNLSKERDDFKAEAAKLGSQDGGTATNVTGGKDSFGDDEDTAQKVIDALPHNRAIADNPLFN